MAPTNRGVSKAQLSQNRSSSGPASDLRSSSNTVAATPIFNTPSSTSSSTTTIGSSLHDTTRPASSFASLTIPFQSQSSSANQMRPDQTLSSGYYNQSYAATMAGPGSLAPALRSPDHTLQQPNQTYFGNNPTQGFGFQSPASPPHGQTFFPGMHSAPSIFSAGDQQLNSLNGSFIESPSSLTGAQNDFSSLYGASDTKSPDQLYMSYPPNSEQSQFTNESLSGSDSMETEAYGMLNLNQDGSSSISPTSPQPLEDSLGSPMAESLEFPAKQEPQSPIQSNGTKSSYKSSGTAALPASSKEKEQNKQKLYRNRKTEFTKKMQDELLAMGMLPSTRITHAPEIMSKTADTLRDYRELLELIRSNVDGMPSNLASVPAAVRKLLIENAGIPGTSPLHRPPQQQQHPQLMQQQQPTHGFKPDIKMPIHPHPHHTLIHPHQQQQQFRSF